MLSDGAATYTPAISERRAGVSTFTHSGLKNTEIQSSSAQAITATRRTDAFGNLLSSSGSWQGPFGYAGDFGYQQDASGLMLLGHRYLDPSTGRFLTRDPIRDGRNWYGYGGGEPGPTLHVDASGTVPEWLKTRIRGRYISSETEAGKATQYQIQLALKRSHGHQRWQDVPGWVVTRSSPRHHVFAQEFRSRFDRILGKGFIDRFTIRLPEWFHRGIHPAWNRAWQQFFKYFDDLGRDPSPKEVIQFMKWLRKEFGIKGEDLKYEPYR